MATISTSGISPGQIIRSAQLLNVINALNGVNPVDIIVKGSLSASGSLNVTGSTFLKGIPNTSRAHVITYDPTTGQLSYLNSASLGVTMSVSQPGGLNTQIQYNSGSVLAATSSFTFNYNLQSLQQGLNVSASNTYAHAQGNQTTASGQYSHAEGEKTQANNLGSHAEGTETIASGNYSHAEGNNTQAIGDASHAEGFWTVASGSYQHVQGQYNLSSSAQSAFIIGNGTSEGARSNLVFASGSQFQVTGSLNVLGSSILRGSSTNYSTSPSIGSDLGCTFGHVTDVNTTGFITMASSGSGHSSGNNNMIVGSVFNATSTTTPQLTFLGIKSGAYDPWTDSRLLFRFQNGYLSGRVSLFEIGTDYIRLPLYTSSRNDSQVAINNILFTDATGSLRSRPVSAIATFPFSGSAIITGSLTISGSNSYNLDVTGNAIVSNYMYANVFQGKFALDGGGNTGMNAVGNGTNIFTSGNSVGITFSSGSLNSNFRELMRITNTGSVGIGTSTPRFTLDISGSMGGSVSATTIASTTASIDLSKANFFTITLVSGSNTHISASNIQPGQTTSIRITQPNPGTGTVTFSSAFKQPSGGSYTPTNTSSSVDILTIVSFDSTNVYMVNVNNLI